MRARLRPSGLNCDSTRRPLTEVHWYVITSPVTAEITSRTSSTRSGRVLFTVHSFGGRLLDGWHLLSLDAPTVALVWTCAFAQAAQVHLPHLGLLMLALATWLLYVADRLLDGIQPSHALSLQARHYFHRRHHKALLLLAIPATAALIWFVLTHMDPAPRREDFFLAGCALLYLLCVHLPFSLNAREDFALPKELFVGIIFSAACVIPAWSRRDIARPHLLLLAILFAALCWLNCVAIEHWEKRGTHDQDKHPSTIWMGVHLVPTGLSLAGAALVCSFFFARLNETRYLDFVLSIAASAFLLVCLDLARSRIQPLRLRAAADAVLLTPAAVLVFTSAWPVLHLI